MGITALNLGIVGCRGRMGKEVIGVAQEDSRVTISAVFCRDGANVEMPELKGAKCCSSLEDLFQSSDVVIDFTERECLRSCLQVASKTGVALVSGTTANDMLPLMREAAKSVPIFWDSNMSYGIAVMNKLVARAAKALKGYDIEVFEMHHRHKKCAVSGTSVKLADIAAEASGTVVDSEFKRGVKSSDKVNYIVSRAGGVFGDHEVIFASEDQILKICHRALNRKIFAKGAVDAAVWMHNLVADGKQQLRLFSTADMCPDI